MIWPWTREETDREAFRGGEPSASGPAPLDAFVAALPDPVLVLDRSMSIIACNPRARALLEGASAGQHLTTAIRAPAVLDAVSAALAGSDPQSVDYEVRVPIPRQFAVYVAATGIDKDAGPAVILVLKDLTREQRIERMRADFVANASHELRTPLASLSGFIETLLGAARSDEKAREKFLDLMRTQAERMKRLVDDLLSLSRIEMNEHQPPADTVDLTSLARQVCDTMQPMAQDEQVEINLAADSGIMVQGDRDELVQVIQNLIENALKYAGTGKRVDIEITRRGGNAELTVADYGPGIAPEHLPRLTERFYRINVQESRSRGGTGLGLAIVKHILNRHHGKLAIASEPGKGSRFTVQLPLADS
jgi:two-component system phosphate regulon sensor histidine kinase PhoR